MSTAIATPPMTAAPPMSVTPLPVRAMVTPPPVFAEAMPITKDESVRLPNFFAPVILRKFSLEEYEKLVELGILTEHDHIELLDGYLVQKMSRNRPHDFGVDQLHEFFVRIVPTGWFVSGQTAVRFASNKPEPDVSIVRGKRTDFRAEHPGPPHVVLVVEVADSSVALDRIDKGRIYANVRIPEYWIINIPERQIEVYTDPTGPGDLAAYRNRKDYLEADSVPLMLDGTAIGSVPVSDLLP